MRHARTVRRCVLSLVVIPATGTAEANDPPAQLVPRVIDDGVVLTRAPISPARPFAATFLVRVAGHRWRAN